MRANSSTGDSDNVAGDQRIYDSEQAQDHADDTTTAQGTNSQGQIISVQETISVDGNATSTLSEDDNGSSTASGSTADNDTFAASDTANITKYSDGLTGSVTTIDSTTGNRTTVTDTSKITGSGSQQDFQSEVDQTATGTAENDTANSSSSGNAGVAWSGSETVATTSANGAPVSPPVTTNESGYDNQSWGDSAGQDLSGYVSGSGNVNEHTNDTPTSTSSTAGETFNQAPFAINANKAQAPANNGGGGWLSKMWGGVKAVAKRADQLVGQINTLAWTGTWVDKEVASGVEVANAIDAGIKVGAKAVVNSAAHTVCSTVSLGNWEGPDLIQVTDADRAMGYDTSAAISRVGLEILGGVATGSAATKIGTICGKFGKLNKAVSYGMRAVDIAQNGNNIVTGVNDIVQNGLNFENGMKVLGGTVASAAGLKGSVKVFKAQCFVADTPIAVGWNNSSIIIIGESDPTTDETNDTVNIGWMLAGLGVIVVTAHTRNGEKRKRGRNSASSDDDAKRLLSNGKPQPDPDFPDYDISDDDILRRLGHPLVNPAKPNSHISFFAMTEQCIDEDFSKLEQRFNRQAPPIETLVADQHNHKIETAMHPSNSSLQQFTLQFPQSDGVQTSQAERAVVPASTVKVVATHRLSTLVRNSPSDSDRVRKPERRRAMQMVVWLFPMLLAGLCFWQALPGAQSGNSVRATAAVGASSASPRLQQSLERKLVTRPIQEIEVGHRVIAKNPELAGQSVPEIYIEPEETRLVQLHMVKPDGHELTIDTLLPLEALFENAVNRLESNPDDLPGPLAIIGSAEDVFLNEVLRGEFLEMNFPEMGVSGPAQITNILPCPEIEADDGTGRRIVTSVFRHKAGNVIDVAIEGESEPIGTTANHPFWSEDRQAFIPAGDLRIGESLRRANGQITHVASLTPRANPEPVYNFEVDGEHVYMVGRDGVLVHNAYNMHHSIPKFLGGDEVQNLVKISKTAHKDFHKLLRKNLKKSGFTLNIGGSGGSALDWANYLNEKSGRQRRALNVVLSTSRQIDKKYGTKIAKSFLLNIKNSKFSKL